ncbi:MAG: PAS domain-containing protein [Acetobacteraceae bacterium]|nr:PAS domain-containing protein [Acetobacteraceae bacterium]
MARLPSRSPRPCAASAQTLDRIAGGDTAVEVGFSGRRDEIGRIAAATERLRSEAERAFLQSQILDQLPQPVMVADPRNDFRITYMNRATRETLASVEHLLPAKVDALVGQSIDIFHREPARVRQILSDPANLPHRARIRLGPETISLSVSAVRDRNGAYVNALLNWELITREVRLAEQLETSVGAVAKRVLGAAQEPARLRRDPDPGRLRDRQADGRGRRRDRPGERQRADGRRLGRGTRRQRARNFPPSAGKRLNRGRGGATGGGD